MSQDHYTQGIFSQPLGGPHHPGRDARARAPGRCRRKGPVIAAGGIADSRGVRAAMALGAAGVQVGTTYLLCPEATTSAVHRAALKEESARRTTLTNIFSGRPARGIVNRLMGARAVSPRRRRSPRGTVHRPAPCHGREPGQRRLLAALVGSECERVPGGACEEVTRELAAGL